MLNRTGSHQALTKQAKTLFSCQYPAIAILSCVSRCVANRHDNCTICCTVGGATRYLGSSGDLPTVKGEQRQRLAPDLPSDHCLVLTDAIEYRDRHVPILAVLLDEPRRELRRRKICFAVACARHSSHCTASYA